MKTGLHHDIKAFHDNKFKVKINTSKNVQVN